MSIQTSCLEYTDGTTALEGFLAYNTNISQAPGVIIVHDWLGVGEYVKSRAQQLATLGYVAFCADIYGKGVRPTGQAAAQEAGKYKSNPCLMRSRINAALTTLQSNPHVMKNRIAIIGYCFGGAVALELCRSGADIQGAVSFHGSLDTTMPAKHISAKILVLHGADDPYVPAQQVAAFEEEMRTSNADWQLVKYGNAVHSFTNPHAGNDPSKGAAYNKEADDRSWRIMKDFFDELFRT